MPDCPRSLIDFQRSFPDEAACAALLAEIKPLERSLHAWHRKSDVSRRLAEIPGVGPLVASALTANLAPKPDVRLRMSGRCKQSAAILLFVTSSKAALSTCGLAAK